MNTILETENLRKEFFLSYFPKRTILACDDINVSIKEGEVDFNSIVNNEYLVQGTKLSKIGILFKKIEDND